MNEQMPPKGITVNLPFMTAVSRPITVTIKALNKIPEKTVESIDSTCPDVVKTFQIVIRRDNNVAERLREFKKILNIFLTSRNLKALVFSSNLSPEERAYIHMQVRSFNLDHKSSGSKQKRTLMVMKPDSNEDGKSNIPMMLRQFSDLNLDSVAGELIESLDPLKTKMLDMKKNFFNAKDQKHSKSYSQRVFFRGNPPDGSDKIYEKRIQLQKDRLKLPTMKMSSKIVSEVKNKDVVIVNGLTGCGKTTQIPQMILDSHILGKNDIIFCVQPRRISAVTVAQRVAAERGEACGNSVGYIVRFDKQTSSNTKIVFMTTGILLQFLQNNEHLLGVGCVIIDEVHERDLNVDFALLILRDLLQNYANPPKIIAMSATIQVEKLVSYFSITKNDKLNIPGNITIPGTLHPVKEMFLEDALKLMGNRKDDSMYENLFNIESKLRGENMDLVEEDQEDRRLKLSELLRLPVLNADLPYKLIASLINYFHTTDKDLSASILVFLPGWANIESAAKEIMSSPHYRKYIIHKLHSAVVAESQFLAFSAAPVGMRKIVFATNIAETSITIDDIVYVIDGCQINGTFYDSIRNVSGLQTLFIGKSNGFQRKGRAGRVRPGVCFHLLPRHVYNALPDVLLPEIFRSPLEEVCLELKAIKKDEQCFSVLSRALDAPPEAAIIQAVKLLNDIGALDKEEKLTSLGRTLAQMPIHPRLGKMMLTAAVLGVLEPISIMVSGMSQKGVFLHVPTEMFQALRSVKNALDEGRYSDHFVAYKLYVEWKKSRDRYDYAATHFASIPSLKRIEKEAYQLQAVILKSGFLNFLRKDLTKPGPKGPFSLDINTKRMLLGYASRHKENTALINFALCWSLYPNIIVYEPKGKGGYVMWDGTNVPLDRKSVIPPAIKIKEKLDDTPFAVYFNSLEIKGVLRVMDGTLLSSINVVLACRNVIIEDEKELDEEHYVAKGARGRVALNLFTKNGSENNNYSLFSVDSRRLIFFSRKQTANALSLLHELITFYFGLSIDNLNAVFFPEELVKEIGKALGQCVFESNMEDYLKSYNVFLDDGDHMGEDEDLDLFMPEGLPKLTYAHTQSEDDEDNHIDEDDAEKSTTMIVKKSEEIDNSISIPIPKSWRRNNNVLKPSGDNSCGLVRDFKTYVDSPIDVPQTPIAAEMFSEENIEYYKNFWEEN